jgi:propionyl-CoA carboxylase alpha chain/3-methylcrotonyl-CoA carboxylase alpha subunit/acetyl-CoA/propionyl-CoA carboxylase biotin carboxyl carrier protein
MECRVCAENPERDFLPETGVVRLLDVPSAHYLRFDNALDAGQRVTADFDPMLAKLVVHGSSREEAVNRTIAALEHLALLGVKTNVDYLARVLDHPAFRAGLLHTGFVKEYAGALVAPELAPETLHSALIAAALGFREFRGIAFGAPEPYVSMGAWRN